MRVSATGLQATGDVIIPDKIVHDGDTNTAIRFPAADTVSFETGGIERARFDSSGNFVVGKTNTTIGVAGVTIEPNGRLETTTDGVTPFLVGRIDEGDMIQFYESTTLRGRIGIESNDLFIASANTGIRFDYLTNQVVPCTTTGAGSDNTDDFGSSSVRWKDGYFGGTITDGDGKIRAIPQSGSDKTSSYTLVVGDVGNFIGIGSGGSITVPNSTFAAGDAISIFNNTSGDRTITLSITTAYIAGDNTDKNSVTLATRGVCTILFISGTVCVLSGNVS